MWSATLIAAILNQPAAGTDPQVLLRRAIQAHGGADKLDRLRLVREESTGILHLRGKKVAYQSVTLQRLPTQFRHTMTSEIEGKNFEILQVYDGKQGWLIEGGLNRPVDAKALTGWKATAHAAHVATLTPLLAADKGYRLRLLPEEMVQGKPAVGLKVEHPEQREVCLFFDRDTGLLVRKLLRPQAGGPDSVQEEIYSDFKDVQGLKRATRVRILINGVPHAETVIRSTLLLERVEDKEFSKP